ncbi:MAG TPA: NADH:flavin oxidoreductase [Candidatus Binatia bacterium]|nr:NADH:flavin oxidoreductase [Candidatus Binatia bacterium]
MATGYDTPTPGVGAGLRPAPTGSSPAPQGNESAKKVSKKYPIPSVHWPTAEEAQTSLWFSPIRIGQLLLEARTWVPAMVPWRATEDGFVTPQVLEWYERYARAQPGVLVVEATGIRDIPSGPLLRIGHDRFLDGLKKMVDVVHRTSKGHTRFLIQIIDFLTIRRRVPKEKYFERFFKLTDDHRRRLAQLTHEPGWEEASAQAVGEKLCSLSEAELAEILTAREFETLQMGYRERVTDMELPHIRELPQVLPGLFADAAERAQKAGFDGVELHYAHAYTMASFLSRLNTRPDGYGGPKEQRVRLPLEVFAAVRARVGADYVVGCRYLSDEIFAGGNRIDDTVYFGVEFAKAGMDFLSISRGGKFEDAKQPRVGEAAYPYTGESGLECMPTVHISAPGPFGRNISCTQQIRQAVRAAGLATPIVATGGIYGFDQAEGILQRGEADIVGAARQSLADPDWWMKMKLGRGGEINRCVFTNYCEGLDQRHKEVTCKLWDRKFTPGEAASLAKDGQRRLAAPEWNP